MLMEFVRIPNVILMIMSASDTVMERRAVLSFMFLLDSLLVKGKSLLKKLFDVKAYVIDFSPQSRI